MKRVIIVFIGFIVAVNFTGCSSGCLVIAPPDIHMTGQKTVIERQIVGEYKELEKDAWIISSVNNSLGGNSQSGSQVVNRKLYVAMQVREFNKKAIRGYKDKGIVGETSEGLLKVMSKKGLSKPDVTKLNAIVKEENRTRNEIFTISLTMIKKNDISKEEIKAFGREFADEQRALAKTGDWIQMKNGSWVKK